MLILVCGSFAVCLSIPLSLFLLTILLDSLPFPSRSSYLSFSPHRTTSMIEEQQRHLQRHDSAVHPCMCEIVRFCCCLPIPLRLLLTIALDSLSFLCGLIASSFFFFSLLLFFLAPRFRMLLDTSLCFSSPLPYFFLRPSLPSSCFVLLFSLLSS